jgi:integrase
MPYKERGGWRASVKIGGARKQAWFPSKREALEWEGKTRKDLKTQRSKTATGLLRLSMEYLDYMERFSKSTYSHRKTLIRRIGSEWGDIEIQSITPKMVLAYLDKRALVSGNAANEDLHDLKSMFSYFRKFHGITHNPMIHIDPYKHEVTPPYVPPKEDIAKLILATRGQDRVMLEMFRYTPARRSEVLRLTWDDILFDRRLIRLKTQKNRKGQWKVYYVPMSTTLYGSLKDHYKGRDKESPYVFTHNGKPYTRRDDWLPKLCKKAKIRPFGYHSFRRAFASEIMGSGRASMKDVSLLLGHSSTTHTERYLRSINPNLPGLVEMLDEKEIYPKDVPHES